MGMTRIDRIGTSQCLDAAAAAESPMMGVGVMYSAIGQPNSCCRGKYNLLPDSLSCN